MSNTPVRRLTPRDTEITNDVARELNREWGLSLGYSFAETLDWCESVVNAADQCILVASDGPRIAGMVLVVDNDLETETALTPWLSALYVLPSARGRGIGKTLVSAAVDFARQENAPWLYLYAASGPLIQLYAALGWETMYPFVQNGSHFTVMKKRLALD